LRRDYFKPVLAAIGGVIVLVVALVVSGHVDRGSSAQTTGGSRQDVVTAMLDGIPQKGIALGNSDAKVTMMVFADPQCPYCGAFARNTFPTIVKRYVRTNKIRIVYEGLSFLGPDSTRMLRLAQAAGLQNKLWNVVEREYKNQGEEGSGYATDAYLKGIVEAVPGLDTEKVLSTSKTSAVVPMIRAADALNMRVFGSYATPSFAFRQTGSKQLVTIDGVSLQALTRAIRTQLAK
jgi:protein-disulfide isomerase